MFFAICHLENIQKSFSKNSKGYIKAVRHLYFSKGLPTNALRSFVDIADKKLILTS